LDVSDLVTASTMRSTQDFNALLSFARESTEHGVGEITGRARHPDDVVLAEQLASRSRKVRIPAIVITQFAHRDQAFRPS
jgi:hypothetical protein